MSSGTPSPSPGKSAGAEAQQGGDAGEANSLLQQYTTIEVGGLLSTHVTPFRQPYATPTLLAKPSCSSHEGAPCTPFAAHVPLSVCTALTFISPKGRRKCKLPLHFASTNFFAKLRFMTQKSSIIYIFIFNINLYVLNTSIEMPLSFQILSVQFSFRSDTSLTRKLKNLTQLT